MEEAAPAADAKAVSQRRKPQGGAASGGGVGQQAHSGQQAVGEVQQCQACSRAQKERQEHAHIRLSRPGAQPDVSELY
jgi:hypothetical protein